MVSGEALGSEESKNQVKAYFEAQGGSLEETSEGLRVQYSNRETAEKVSILVMQPRSADGRSLRKAPRKSRSSRESSMRRGTSLPALVVTRLHSRTMGVSRWR
jgi:hypothetical protein